MTQPPINDPVSAIFVGMRAALSGWLGFVLALVVGVVIAVIGCGLRLEALRNEFFLRDLFFHYPLLVITYLRNVLGLATALAGVLLTIGFYYTERFKAECLLALCLTVGFHCFLAFNSGGTISSRELERLVAAMGILVISFFLARIICRE